MAQLQHKSLSVLNINSKGEISFGFNSIPPKKISGIDILTQNIIIRLFTDYSSNFFEKNLGGNLYNIIGKGYIPGDEDLLQSSFINIFDIIEKQIKNEQSSQTSLPPFEKLRSIKLKSIEYNQDTQSWNIIIKINTVAGLSATYTIVS